MQSACTLKPGRKVCELTLVRPAYLKKKGECGCPGRAVRVTAAWAAWDAWAAFLRAYGHMPCTQAGRYSGGHTVSGVAPPTICLKQSCAAAAAATWGFHHLASPTVTDGPPTPWPSMQCGSLCVATSIRCEWVVQRVPASPDRQ